MSKYIISCVMGMVPWGYYAFDAGYYALGWLGLVIQVLGIVGMLYFFKKEM